MTAPPRPPRLVDKYKGRRPSDSEDLLRLSTEPLSRSSGTTRVASEQVNAEEDPIELTLTPYNSVMSEEGAGDKDVESLLYSVPDKSRGPHLDDTTPKASTTIPTRSLIRFDSELESVYGPQLGAEWVYNFPAAVKPRTARPRWLSFNSDHTADHSLPLFDDGLPYDTVNPAIRPVKHVSFSNQQSDSKQEAVYSLQQASDWEYDFPPPTVKPLTARTQRESTNTDLTFLQNVTLRRDVKGQGSKPLTLSHTYQRDGDKLRIVLELKSPETSDANFERVPLRLVCLFDTSGSMRQSCGSRSSRRRDTKLVKMRDIAKVLAQTLEDTDYLGVLEFGNTAEVLWPLTKNDHTAKKEVLAKVRELGRNGLSLTTNLSQALFAAIDMFRQDSRTRGLKCFETRDLIVVLTDGDINDGITNGQVLVREVRQALRALEMEGNQYSKEPSLTISTVVTGNNVADAVYLLSKTCGSDAYYYIDKDTDTFEVSALMPVLLRKTSAASSISVRVQALDPAEMIPKFCSHEYMAHRPHERDDEVNYFIHDLVVGTSKHLLIVLDEESVMCETDLEASVLQVNVDYRDSLMRPRSFIYDINRGEFERQQANKKSTAVCIQDIRRISQLALRNVADFIRDENCHRALVALQESSEEVQKEVEQFNGSLSKPSDRQMFTDFVRSVTANLMNLMEIVEDSQSSSGQKWSAVKSVSSAIVRESPSAPKLVAQKSLATSTSSMSPEISKINKLIKDQYSRTGVKSAIFYDFETTMSQFNNSLQRGAVRPSSINAVMGEFSSLESGTEKLCEMNK